jgi:hypothetical protein
MGVQYARYMQAHGEKAPPNEQAFRDFLATRQSELEQAGLSVDAMFVSPRNGAPLMWVYGSEPMPNRGGLNYVGYETSSSDGKRLIISSQGIAETLDEGTVRTIFPNLP